MESGLLLRAAASLAAVVIMALLAGRLVRARLRLPPQQPGALRLRATLALDTRRRLHLVETEAGPVLILTGGGSDSLLPWPSHTTPP
jgi:flagellar protein FliO/FliZ